MEKTRTRRRYPLRYASLAVLGVLLILYIPLRSEIARSERAKDKPAPGTAISVFFTSRLGGYREPCG